MAAAGTKRKLASTQATLDTTLATQKRTKPNNTLSNNSVTTTSPSPTPSPPPSTQADSTSHYLTLIASSPHGTPFDKRVWSLLLQIPRGQVSTYGVMSAHLKSSPRAIGNAMRRNPFAPGVPCHRCVATGGQLGGFKGHWPGKDAKKSSLEGERRLGEKRRLLRSEGVRIDGRGRVVGTPFGGFV